MKTLYLDCGMGAAGDMLAAALLELVDDPAQVLEQLNSMGLPGVTFALERREKCGIQGHKLVVKVGGVEEGTHAHGFRPMQPAPGASWKVKSAAQTHQAEHRHEEPKPPETDPAQSALNQVQQVLNDVAEKLNTWLKPDASGTDTTRPPAQDTADGLGIDQFFGNIAQQVSQWFAPDGHRQEAADSSDHSLSHSDDHVHQHAHGHHHHDHGHGDEHHHHASMDHIAHVVSHLALPQPVKDHIMAVYHLIAEAESQVHGVPVTQIHFHEVGEMDAIADIAAVSLLMHLLRPGQVVASPVHVGSGTVRCAHGVLPVPAPATALILRGMPIYSGDIQGELCTPTGAALLKHFVHQFGPMPQMAVSKVGYGMGTKDFPVANCLRAMLGETAQEADRDDVLTLSTNLDDMTGEDMAFATETLLKAGALDVWTQSIQMKKGRPGILLHVLCTPAMEAEMTALLFRHTTTLGIRVQSARRHVLQRTEQPVETPLGMVRKKAAARDNGTDEKWAYEDLAALAREKGLSLKQVRDMLRKL